MKKLALIFLFALIGFTQTQAQIKWTDLVGGKYIEKYVGSFSVEPTAYKAGYGPLPVLDSTVVDLRVDSTFSYYDTTSIAGDTVFTSFRDWYTITFSGPTDTVFISEFGNFPFEARKVSAAFLIPGQTYTTGKLNAKEITKYYYKAEGEVAGIRIFVEGR